MVIMEVIIMVITGGGILEGIIIIIMDGEMTDGVIHVVIIIIMAGVTQIQTIILIIITDGEQEIITTAGVLLQ